MTKPIPRSTHKRNGFKFSFHDPDRRKAHPATFFERLEAVKRECKRQCIRPFAPLIEVEKIYRNFICTIFLNQKERGDLIFSAIEDCKILGKEKRVLKALGMTPLCQKCFSLALGLSERDMQRKSNLVNNGVLQHVHGGGSGTVTSSKCSAIPAGVAGQWKLQPHYQECAPWTLAEESIFPPVQREVPDGGQIGVLSPSLAVVLQRDESSQRAKDVPLLDLRKD